MKRGRGRGREREGERGRRRGRERERGRGTERGKGREGERGREEGGRRGREREREVADTEVRCPNATIEITLTCCTRGFVRRGGHCGLLSRFAQSVSMENPSLNSTKKCE